MRIRWNTNRIEGNIANKYIKRVPKSGSREKGAVTVLVPWVVSQFLGTISVVVFVFVVSYIVWSIMKMTIGIRISKEAERLGTDKSEVGVIAYGIRD